LSVWHYRYCNVSGQNKRPSIECRFQDRYINAIIVIISTSDNNDGEQRSRETYVLLTYFPHLRVSMFACENCYCESDLLPYIYIYIYIRVHFRKFPKYILYVT